MCGDNHGNSLQRVPAFRFPILPAPAVSVGELLHIGNGASWHVVWREVTTSVDQIDAFAAHPLQDRFPRVEPLGHCTLRVPVPEWSFQQSYQRYGPDGNLPASVSVAAQAAAATRRTARPRRWRRVRTFGQKGIWIIYLRNCVGPGREARHSDHGAGRGPSGEVWVYGLRVDFDPHQPQFCPTMEQLH